MRALLCLLAVTLTIASVTADNAYNTICYDSPIFSYYVPGGALSTAGCTKDFFGALPGSGADISAYFNQVCQQCCQVFMITRATTTSKNNQGSAVTWQPVNKNGLFCTCCIYTKGDEAMDFNQQKTTKATA